MKALFARRNARLWIASGKALARTAHKDKVKGSRDENKCGAFT